MAHGNASIAGGCESASFMSNAAPPWDRARVPISGSLLDLERARMNMSSPSPRMSDDRGYERRQAALQSEDVGDTF